MHGIDYIVDDTGKEKSVVIDLRQWGELWEDFQDILVIEQRKNEPTISWEDMKREEDAVHH